MRSRSPSAALVVLFLAGFALVFAQAATVPIIWQFYNSPPPTVNVKCGDTLAFQVSGRHDVIEVAEKSCTAKTIKEWAPVPAPALVSVPITKAGTTYYLCNVGTHCKDFNMLIQVTATGPCPGATPSPSPKAASPSPSPKAASPSPKAASPPPAAKSPTPAPAPSPKPAPVPSPKSSSPKRSPPKKKPAPCHTKPSPPCKKSRAHGK